MNAKFRRDSWWRLQQRVTTQRYTRELMLRDERVLDYVARSLGPVNLSDVRIALGLSYAQAACRLARLEYFGDIGHSQGREWGGVDCIHPHTFWAK